jgi:hypothetical protein
MKLKAAEANPFLKTMSIHDAFLMIKKQRQDRRVAKRISSWTMVSFNPIPFPANA